MEAYMWHGYGANGAMGTGAVANLSVFTKVNTPETGAEVKYINAGLINTSLVLKDNTVWESGYNVRPSFIFPQVFSYC